LKGQPRPDKRTTRQKQPREGKETTHLTVPGVGKMGSKHGKPEKGGGENSRNAPYAERGEPGGTSP